MTVTHPRDPGPGSGQGQAGPRGALPLPSPSGTSALIGAKGELLAGTAAATLDNLAAAGGADYFLVSDPDSATGLAWDLSPIHNVKGARYGAVGDGTTDDRVAIQAAIDAAAAAGGGTVFIPIGTYSVTRAASGSAWAMQPKSNVIIQGAGPGTVIKLVSGSIDFTRIFSTAGAAATDWSIRDLTIDGNKAGQAPGEHMHGIFFNDTSRVLIENVVLQNCMGDGADLYSGTHDVTFRGCRILNNDRNGLTFGGGVAGLAVSKLRVLSCHFEGNDDTCVDSEPSSGYSQDVLIQGNTMIGNPVSLYAMTMGGAGGADLNADWRVLSNHITSGGIQILRAKRMTIANNVIEVNVTTRPCIRSHLDAYDINIIGNELIGGGTDATIFMALSAGLTIERVTIVGNNITSIAGSTASGIRVNGGRRVVISDNTIDMTAGGGRGIYSSATGVVDHFVVTGNTIKGSNTATTGAIQISASGVIVTERVVVTGNILEGTATHGIYLNGASTVYGSVVISGNISTGFPNPVTVPAGLPVVIAGSVGGRADYLGTGTPEAVLTAPVGSTFRRTDGGASTTFYIKETGTGNTGWRAV